MRSTHMIQVYIPIMVGDDLKTGFIIQSVHYRKIVSREPGIDGSGSSGERNNRFL